MSVLQQWRESLRGSRPLIMGVLNVTPDSFSDGGRYLDTNLALHHAEKLIADGADILDIGGESTRPGAASVPLDEELRRVMPIIEALTRRFDFPISIDTYKPAVMQAAVDAGVVMINDVRAAQEPGALQVMANSGVTLCLMHMQGQPATMQTAPVYGDVVAEVEAFLLHQAQGLMDLGIEPKDICLDPGFGFGKTLEQNILLLKSLPRLANWGFPLLAGMSNKRMLGEILQGAEVDQRQVGNVVAHLRALTLGAKILRVHDVHAMRQTLHLWEALW